MWLKELDRIAITRDNVRFSQMPTSPKFHYFGFAYVNAKIVIRTVFVNMFNSNPMIPEYLNNNMAAVCGWRVLGGAARTAEVCCVMCRRGRCRLFRFGGIVLAVSAVTT